MEITPQGRQAEIKNIGKRNLLKKEMKGINKGWDSAPTESTDTIQSKKIIFFFGAVLVVVTAVLFARSLGYGFVILDDYSKVIENPNVTSYSESTVEDRFLTPNQGYVIPVTLAAWASIYAAGGGKPRPFRVVNLVIHISVILLMFGFLLRFSLPVAFFCAGVLALHPVVVEPVAWVTGLKDLLAAIFAIGGIILFITGVERIASDDELKSEKENESNSVSENVSENESSRSLVLAAALLFILAALSKPTTVLLPSALMVWLFSRERNPAKHRPRRSTWGTIVAVQIICIGLALLSWAGHETLTTHSPNTTNFGDGSALYVLGLQVQNLIWPMNLHPLYYVADGMAWTKPYTWLGIVVLIGICFAFYRSRNQPMTLLGISMMVACYLPVSNLLTTPRRVADSYLYLPLAGSMIALASVIPHIRNTPLLRKTRIPAHVKTFALPFVVLIILTGAAAISFFQSHRWSGGTAFWGPLMKRWPNWDRGYYGLASLRIRQKRDKEAAELFRKAYSRGYRTEHLSDYGVALAASGHLDEAECVLIEAIHYGNRPEESLRNYGRLLGDRPRRAPRYPIIATRLVPAAMVALSEHSKEKSIRTIKGLDLIRRRLGPPSKKVQDWPKANCPQLSTSPRFTTSSIDRSSTQAQYLRVCLFSRLQTIHFHDSSVFHYARNGEAP